LKKNYLVVLLGPIKNETVTSKIWGGPDVDSRGEENYAFQLNWTPRDDLEFNIRNNIITVHRVMSGADGGGLVVFRSENVNSSRNYTRLVNGFRHPDPNQTNPLDPTLPRPEHGIVFIHESNHE